AFGATDWKAQSLLIRSLILLERCRTIFLQFSAYIYLQITYIGFQSLFRLPPVHAPGHKAGQDLLSKALEELFQPAANGGFVHTQHPADLRQGSIIQEVSR